MAKVELSQHLIERVGIICARPTMPQVERCVSACSAQRTQRKASELSGEPGTQASSGGHL